MCDSPVVLYLQGSSLDRGPTPPDLSNDLISFVTPVILDTPTWNHIFGDCIKQPADVVEIGETVTAKFVS
jgi:neutral ceramidase